MARGMGKESGPGTLVGGWFMLLGLAFLFNILPLVVIVCIIYFIGRRWVESIDPPTTEPEVTVYDFDTYDVGELPTYVPEPTKPTVPDNIVEDAVSVLVNLRTNKGLAKEAVTLAVENGAETIEEIIKQSLQSLNKR